MKLRVNMRVLKGMAIGLSVLVILMAMALLLRTLDEDQGRETAPDASSNAEGSGSSALEEAGDTRELTYYNGGWYARRDDLETILLMGLDKYADTEESTYVNNQQADFLMLLVMNKDTGACTPIQLNRDTMTKIQILGVRGGGAGAFSLQPTLFPPPPPSDSAFGCAGRAFRYVYRTSRACTYIRQRRTRQLPEHRGSGIQPFVRHYDRPLYLRYDGRRVDFE